MRIGHLLTISLLGIALLVGILGALLERTSAAVGREMNDLRSSSIEEVMAADGMDKALRTTEAAAYRILSERYRQRPGDASHEEEWGAVPRLDLEAIEDGLELFEDSLERSRQALALSSRLSPGAESVGADSPPGSGLEERRSRLRAIEREFAVHQQLQERLVHLMRYHPTEQVREFIVEDFEPHYRQQLRPLIRDFAAAARVDLTTEAQAAEALIDRATRRNRWLAGAAFALAVLLGLLLSRAISRPLGQLRDAALRLGEGDLEQQVEVRGHSEFELLARAFNDMAANLQATTVSRAYLDNVLQSMTEMVLVFDVDGRLRMANEVATRELAASEEDLRGRLLEDFVAEPEALLVEGTAELEMRAATGEAFPASLSRSELRSSGGETEGFLVVARNITERRQAEEELRESLRDKDLLLKEIHHRVKNNLQIVSSLLRLQEGDSPESSKGLVESQNRIRSMALIHEHLYRSPDLASIDFRAYLEELVENLIASYGDRLGHVKTRFDVASEPLDLDTAIPCGMIVNELVANALEHGAGDGDEAGAVEVLFGTEGDERRLEVRNQGSSLPDGFDIGATRSLGLRLVTALAQQIGGELEYGSAEGSTRFGVTFRRSSETVQ